MLFSSVHCSSLCIVTWTPGAMYGLSRQCVFTHECILSLTLSLSLPPPPLSSLPLTEEVKAELKKSTSQSKYVSIVSPLGYTIRTLWSRLSRWTLPVVEIPPTLTNLCYDDFSGILVELESPSKVSQHCKWQGG